MKNLSLLFTVFLLIQFTSLAQEGWFEQTKETNLNTTGGIIDPQDNLLPIVGRNIHIGTPHQFEATNYKNRFLPNELKRNPSPTHRILSPQSQIYVIDTAIVISGYFYPSDTTRHLYSYNASAKRTSDLAQKLIGEYWVDTRRHTNTYDESNNMLTSLHEDWENGQWVIDSRSTYTYDAQGNMLTELYERWDNGLLVTIWSDTFTYDAQGNMLTSLSESWENGQLMSSGRSTYTYDAQGNMLTNLREEWDNGQWVIHFRITYTYDAQGNKLTQLTEIWANGQLDIWFTTYTYDSQGNMLTHLFEIWENGQWVIDSRGTYTYDAQGNMLTRLDERWENGQWAIWSRSTHIYDAQGNMLTRLYERWENGQWAIWSRSTYIYDAQGNMLTHLYETWENGQLVDILRETYTYDEQGNLTSFWNHRWFESSWIPWQFGSFSGFVVIDIAGNVYNFYGYNFTFTYKHIITEVVSESRNAPEHYSLWQNYPNPFNPSTKIKYSVPQSSNVVIKIFDVLGNEIETLINEEKQIGTYEVEFKSTSLPSGVYFYRFQAGDFVETKKMILMK